MSHAQYQRPRTLQGETIKEEVHCTDSCFLILNKESNVVKEVFSKIGSAGSCAAAIMDALTKVISIALSYGVPEHAFFLALCGIGCGSQNSCVSALGAYLENREQDVKHAKKPALALTRTYNWNTGCGDVQTTCFGKPGELNDVLVTFGKPSTCASAIATGLQNAISVALRYDVEPSAIANALNGITCPKASGKAKLTKADADAGNILGQTMVEVIRPSCITAIALSMIGHINPVSDENQPIPVEEAEYV
jgi:hypothetical protein